MNKLACLKFAIIVSCLFPICVAAQDKTISAMKQGTQRTGEVVDSVFKFNAKGWRKGVILSLNFGQGSSSNWAAGAEHSSFSMAGYATLFASKKKGNFYWNNTLDLAYAMQKTSSQGSRKTDDKIDFYTKAGHKLNDKWAVAGVVNFRTQFADGFEYNYLDKELKHRISGFMAPSYLLVSPGLEWTPAPYFSAMISPISARWVIVTNDPYSYYYPDGQIPLPDGGVEKPLAATYGVNPVRKISFEAGAYLSLNFLKELFKNVTYRSKMDFFSNYVGKRDPYTDEKISPKPQNIDIYWTNQVIMKVNKFLNVSYNFDLIYDDDVRQFGPNRDAARPQVKSLLSVGLTTKF